MSTNKADLLYLFYSISPRPGVILITDPPKDEAQEIPSLRTLGIGHTQAAAGDDPRFAESRPPGGLATGGLDICRSGVGHQLLLVCGQCPKYAKRVFLGLRPLVGP